MDLAKLLNTVPGCKKEWDKWRKVSYMIQSYLCLFCLVILKVGIWIFKFKKYCQVSRIEPGMAFHQFIFDHEEEANFHILNPMKIGDLPVVGTVT